jgi:aspartyl-tRNA(Asn)/glutamyl-tRNA(Gln) amidotransferase subunit C
MSLSRADVEKVALLGRLRLSNSEIETLTPQLVDIVGYVDQLSEAETQGVEPMAHAIELADVFADDEVRPSLARHEALRNAPHHNDQGYLVPAVLGD